MLNSKLLDEISAKLSEAVAKSPAKDIEKNARALLAQGFAKLDLVTREEFDVQTQLLSRTAQRLAELEAKVAALEAQKQSGENQRMTNVDHLTLVQKIQLY